MNTKLSIFAMIMAITLIVTTPYVFAQESISALQIDTTNLNIEPMLIIVGIGFVGAVATSFEGWQRSGKPFNIARFIIAVKRTAAISIPSAIAMIVVYPNPDIMSYVSIGLVIILGSKMMGKTPKKIVNSLDDLPYKPIDVKSSSAITLTQTVRVGGTITIPKLGPKGAKYQTNFAKDRGGNTLPFGSDLWIKRTGVRSYITAILRDSAGNAIQVDQSHTKDEDGDIETTRLEMHAIDGQPLPRGKYTVQSQGDAGSSDATGTKSDEFSIV